MDQNVAIAIGAFALVYLGKYLVGARNNKALCKQIFDALQPELARQFHQGQLSNTWKDSPSEFAAWVTGRRNIKGLAVEIELSQRQDMLAGVIGKVHASLAGNTTDTIHIEIPLNDLPEDAVAQPIRLAVVSDDAAKEVIQRKDIKKHAQKVLKTAFTGISSGHEAWCEHSEVFSHLFQKEDVARLNKLTAAPGVTLHSLHITDDSHSAAFGVSKMSPRAIRMTLQLTDQRASAESLSDTLGRYVSFALHVADRVATVKVPSDVATTIRNSRQKLDTPAISKAEARRKAQEEKEEREVRKRKEMEAKLATMSREERRKHGEAMRKEELKAMMPKPKKL